MAPPVSFARFQARALNGRRRPAPAGAPAVSQPPSEERVTVLMERLTRVVGEGRVGSPRPVEGGRRGAFDLLPFVAAPAPEPPPPPASQPPRAALRRFRLPVPVRVTLRHGRPVRIQSDRHGVAGGEVLHVAGPWRASSLDAAGGASAVGWDRDEWDVELAGGLVYRLFVDREPGHWFIDGIVD